MLSCFSFIILLSIFIISPKPPLSSFPNESFFSLFSLATLKHSTAHTLQVMLHFAIDSTLQAHELKWYYVFCIIHHNHACKLFVLQTKLVLNIGYCVFVFPVGSVQESLRPGVKPFQLASHNTGTLSFFWAPKGCMNSSPFPQRLD